MSLSHSQPSEEPEKEQRQEPIVFSGIPKANIVWLRQQKDMDEKAQEVFDAMMRHGIHVTIADAFDVSADELERADLILLDAYSKVDGIVETIVSRIRFESQAPLIMLTSGFDADQLINALTAGADAIWSLNTPVDILVVRCRALLRRWLSPDR